MTDRNTRSPRWRRGALLPGIAILATAACDFEVTNPGPTADAFLDSLNAHEAVVTGVRRDLGQAMQNITYWAAAMTYEINPAGSTGSFGIPTNIQDGRFDEFDSNDWTNAAQARWVAENAFARFERALTQIENAPDINSYEPAATAMLYAGYANRLLGENFCEVTFDGGPVVSHLDAFRRAIPQFQQAQTIATAAGATDIATAAQAGLASVQAFLATYGQAGDPTWADAAATAAGVTDNAFVFAMPYSNQDQDQFNRIHFANGNEPYRAHTVWSTWFEDYFEATADPRVPWQVGDCPDCPDPANPTGDAAVDKFGGQVPWFTQMKFDEPSSPINLSSGWEMRLIQAEAALSTGDFNGAAGFMDQRRATDLGLTGVVVTDVASGYTALYEERMYELWMEGRRMGDVHRWLDNGLNGGVLRDGVWMDTTGDGNNDTRIELVNDNHRAYPIGRGERETNTNVPATVNFCT